MKSGEEAAVHFRFHVNPVSLVHHTMFMIYSTCLTIQRRLSYCTVAILYHYAYSTRKPLLKRRFTIMRIVEELFIVANGQ